MLGRELVEMSFLVLLEFMGGRRRDHCTALVFDICSDVNFFDYDIIYSINAFVLITFMRRGGAPTNDRGKDRATLSSHASQNRYTRINIRPRHVKIRKLFRQTLHHLSRLHSDQSRRRRLLPIRLLSSAASATASFAVVAEAGPQAAESARPRLCRLAAAQALSVRVSETHPHRRRSVDALSVRGSSSAVAVHQADGKAMRVADAEAEVRGAGPARRQPANPPHSTAERQHQRAHQRDRRGSDRASHHPQAWRHAQLRGECGARDETHHE